MSRTLKRLLRKVAEINRRYREARIEMSTGVKISLLFLRMYLIFLVCLMAYKFILLLK